MFVRPRKPSPEAARPPGCEWHHAHARHPPLGDPNGTAPGRKDRASVIVSLDLISTQGAVRSYQTFAAEGPLFAPSKG